MKLKGNVSEAKDEWLKGAQKGYESCMNALGGVCLNELKIEESFYWYMLSHYLSTLKGISSITAWKRLEEIASKETSFPHFKSYIESIRFGPQLEAELEAQKDVANQNSNINIKKFKERARILANNAIASLTISFDETVRESFYEGIGELLEDRVIWKKIGYIMQRDGESNNRPEYFAQAAAYYCKAKTPDALVNLSNLIKNKKVHQDENGKPINSNNRLDIVARILKLANNDMARYNYSILIDTGYKKGWKGNKLNTEKEVFNEYTSLIIKAMETVPDAIMVLVTLIMEGKINNYNGVQISEKNRSEEAAFLLRQVANIGLKEALIGLASYIYDGEINTDENGKKFEEEDRYEVAARIFRKADTPESWYMLGLLIEKRKLLKDEKGMPIFEKDCAEAAALWYRKAALTVDKALHNLAVLIKEKKSIKGYLMKKLKRRIDIKLRHECF